MIASADDDAEIITSGEIGFSDMGFVSVLHK